MVGENDFLRKAALVPSFPKCYFFRLEFMTLIRVWERRLSFLFSLASSPLSLLRVSESDSKGRVQPQGGVRGCRDGGESSFTIY